jgi:stress-induced morphogen
MTEVTNVITITDKGSIVECKTFATKELAEDYCREELSMTESEIENGEHISCDGSFDCHIKTTKIEGKNHVKRNDH